MDAGAQPGSEALTAEAVATDAAPRWRGVTIQVADVPPATDALAETTACLAIDGLLMPRRLLDTADDFICIEACSNPDRRLLRGIEWHPALAAVHLAFCDHRPLVLSPDIVWMLIAQGFAQHVLANAEGLRSRFVRHPGQLEIEIRRDDLVKGAANNDWPGVVDELTAGVREHIGSAAYDLLVPAFTTTGASERTAAQVVLLDAMQSYFTYRVVTMCGIPQVVLEGTAADWLSLAQRADALGEFELRWWTDPLRPILAELVASARGAARAEFWQSIYKHLSGSGGPFVTGWISAFFPYLRGARTERATRKNPIFEQGGAALAQMLEPSDDRSASRITTEAFPSGLARAPFRWKYLNETYDMELLAGFVGVRQDPETLSLRPEIGWALSEPARRDAIEATRRGARQVARTIADERAFQRASEWKSKALCRQCGTWVYQYGDAAPRHCGRGLPDAIAREPQS
jgi:hypothetical protein